MRYVGFHDIIYLWKGHDIFDWFKESGKFQLQSYSDILWNKNVIGNSYFF